jgi:hypothetical protein
MAERTAFFSRDELLGGLPARRASTLLFAIESRTAHLIVRSREAMASYLNERAADERHGAFLEAMAQGRALPVSISVQDLERYAPAWAPLVPAEPALQAELFRLVAAKYQLASGRVPGIAAALGVTDPAVVASFAGRGGAAIDSVYASRLSIRDRWHWWRAAAAFRLEHLPAFWMAFALTLTETIGEGILTVPIAVAGLGPIGGIVVLVVLGVVNLVTIGAMVEAITRDGDMRYGSAYFGRLVANFLGGAGTALMSPSMVILDIICLLTYAIGFASAVGAATGINPEVWVAVLLVANLLYTRRDSMSATVASAIVVGAVNVALILLICLVALPFVSPDRLLAGPSGINGAPFRVTDLGIVFGVILVAYFGHTSAGNAAKVVLAQDPTGRQLLWGNIAAMTTVIALYCLVTFVVLGAVPAANLVGYAGTPVAPLAAVAGPLASIAGSIYVVIAIGFGSIYMSLSLFNQVAERLPPLPGRGDPKPTGLRGLAFGRIGRVVLGLAPTVGIFAVVEAMFATGTESFTAPLGFLGLLTCALLGGVLPMLMVAASRRRGDIVPGTVVRITGHPVTVVIVTALYVAAIALNGLFIWQSPMERLLAAVAALAALGLVLRSFATGAYRPRTVVEVRVDEGDGERVRLDVSSAGRRLPVPITLDADAAPAGEATAGGYDLGRARGLRSVRIVLPGGITRDLKVWLHRTTLDGESQAWPAIVMLGEGDVLRVVPVDAGTGRAIAMLDDGAQGLRIEPARSGTRPTLRP